MLSGAQGGVTTVFREMAEEIKWSNAAVVGVGLGIRILTKR